MTDNKEKPAFPTNGRMHSDMVGLSKREYFAVIALQGILSNPSNSNMDLMGVNTSGPLGFIAANFAVKEAIGYADELLKQPDND